MAERHLDLIIASIGVALLLGVILLTVTFADNLGDALTRNTVRLAIAWYAVALSLMMRRSPGEWDGSSIQGRLARWCWTWGWVTFLVHVAMAFHYFHQWSHQEAFERTRAISGVGEGLYVSYLFTLLWAVDVFAWWIGPVRYSTRSPWIDRALHGFMLFVVFNAMVVYESGSIRWVGLALSLSLAAEWVMSRETKPAEPSEC